MRQRTKEKQIELDDMLLPVNTYDGTRECYVEVLTAIHNQMSAMLSHHRKVLMVRLDVHVHDRTPDNKIMSDFTERLARWASGKYKKNVRTGYVWCRELSTDKGLHYHLVLMFNGSAIESYYHVLKKAQQIAEYHAHRGYRNVPYFEDSPMHMMINRGDEDSYRKAFEWASYLAKTRTKDNKYRSDKAQNYGSSRIKPKQQKPDIS